jgi:hypothetical protein
MNGVFGASVAICDVCGVAPCETPVFCEVSRRAERARTKLPASVAPSKAIDRMSGNTVPPSPATWQQAAFTAEQLRLMTFEPIAWIVPEIIPAEGVTLLCSRPKFGKSWLAYDLCIGATTNRFILGEIKPAQGDVLYLALEDSRRRLQRRMTKLLPTFSGKWPDKLTITTEWRRLHEGGLDDIRAWHQDAKAKVGNPILVVIDVLAKVRKPTGGTRSVYEADYEALTGLHRLSHELGIAILVVHHTRKAAADDLMETVSGSNGITGAADTVIVMAKKGGGALLDIRGRDVEAAELAIQFSKDACRWTILGTAADVHQSDQRKAIIAALTDSGEPMHISALTAATWMRRNPLELLLGRMVKDGSIKRLGSGRYAHKDHAEQPRPTKKPTKAYDPHKSVRSVSSVSPSGQISARGQPTDGAQKSAGICRSVRSVRKFTSNADAPGSVAEPVKAQTDQTDGQIGAQAAEKEAKSDFKNLSGPETDQTGRRILTGVAYEDLLLREEAAPEDDLTIAPSCQQKCDHCQQYGGAMPFAYGTAEGWLHRECMDAWKAAYDDLDIRNRPFYRPEP